MQTVEFDRLLDGGERVLDIGCGEGRHSHGAALHDAGATVVGCDIDAERLRNAKEGFASLDLTDGDDTAEKPDSTATAVESEDTDASAITAPAFARADIFSLPFAADAFDVVVCAEILEHLPAYEDAIDELARVLKPGGRLAASVPRYGPERVCWALSDAYHAVEGGHVRIFHRDELREALEAHGLKSVDTGFAHALHSPYWWLKCLWWNHDEPPAPLAAYERFLEWVIVNETPTVDALERALDPVVGKSLVYYCVNENSQGGAPS